MLSQLAHAAEKSCRHLALTEGFSESLPDSQVIKSNDKNLPPSRDQDSIGYCYAYATADMYETWLKSKNYIDNSESISAVALGLADHKENWDKRTQEFNLIKSAPAASLESRYQESSALYENLKQIKAEHSAAQSKLISEKYSQEVAVIKELFSSESEADKEKANILQKELKAKINSEEEIKEIVARFAAASQQLNQSGPPIAISSVYDIREANVANPDNKLRVQGGQSQKLLEKLWDSYCFESEVSSKDLQIKKVYTDYRDLLDDSSITPDSINRALGYINSDNFEERNTCASLAITQSIFQNLPFSSPEEFKKFIDSSDPQRSLVQQILEKSCKPKAPPVKPSIKSVAVSEVTVPVQNNEKVLAAIDSALELGQIASVGYNVNILLTPDSTELGAHESTIIGSAKLCGEEAYILRNTYGVESCKNFQGKYLKKAQNNLPINMEFATCLVDTQEKSAKKYPNCSDNKCLSAKGNFEKELLDTCYAIRDKYQSENIELPYACDSKGNFIIPKTKFKKGVYLANYIDN